MNADDLRTLWVTMATIGGDGAHPDTVRAAVKAVLQLHEPVSYQGKAGTTLCRECVKDWPCQTVQAVAGTIGLRITVGDRRVL